MAVAVRRAVHAVAGVFNDPENAGNEANDYIASMLLARLCLPGRVFVDVGSHIGSVIADVARHSPGVSIESVEADPEKAANLVRKFPGVRVHSCAASDEEGQFTFYVDTLRPGYSSLVKPADAVGIREITVPVHRLDDILAGLPVDVIKIDVEGAELGVLRGAEKLVGSHRPSIMFESVGGGEEEWRRQWRWFTDRGYELLAPNRMAHTAPGMSEDIFIDSHAYPRRCSNYFGVARERRDELRLRSRLIQGFA